MTTPALGDLISVALPTITSPGRRLPRDGGADHSANSDEVTGATLNDGETGGTWTKAGELLGVTRGPDGGLAVFIVRDADRRHDLGRQHKREHEDPVNSISLTFGFFRRGKPGPIHHPEISTQSGTQLPGTG